jgi:diguanylate cyclase (GGDEF)-like protein
MATNNRVIYAYICGLGVAVLGAIVGLLIGNYYQKGAEQVRQTAAYERRLLSQLQIETLYNRPTKQLAPHVQDSEGFHRASNEFIQQLKKIETILGNHRQSDQSTTLPGLDEFLDYYEQIVAEFMVEAIALQSTLQPLVSPSNEAKPAQDEIIALVIGSEFIAFIEAPDRMREFHNQAIEREAKAEQALAQVEVLRTHIILGCLGISVLSSVLLLSYSQKIQRQADRDALTGSLSRASLLKYGQRLLSNAQQANGSLSVMMLDVDHFKRINDTHGHACGDLVLQEIVEIASSIYRPSDYFGRLGGEEFAAILGHTPIEEAKSLAQAVITSISESAVRVGNEEIYVTVSIGLAGFRQGDRSLSEILRRADKALYQAKSNGRNRVELEMLEDRS